MTCFLSIPPCKSGPGVKNTALCRDGQVEQHPLVRRKHGVTKLKCLGGFKNNRRVYEWRGHTLELDETMFEWGTCYELELETVSSHLSNAVRPLCGVCFDQ